MSKELAWVEGAFNTAQEVVGDVVEKGEDALCDVWKAVIPPPLQQGLKLTQQQPWRGLWRGFNLTAPTMVQFALPPITFPLAILFFPILIWLETTRIAFAIFANCGRVTTTLQREAADLILVLDQLGPNKPVGQVIRTTLNLAGQGGIVTSFDQFYPKIRALLNPVSRKQPMSANAVLTFAMASAQMSGDARVIGLVTQTDSQLAALEETAVQVMGPSNNSGTKSTTASASSTNKSTPARQPRSKAATREASRQAARDRQAAREAKNPALEAERTAARAPAVERARLAALERASSRESALQASGGMGGYKALIGVLALGGLGLLWMRGKK